MELKKGQAIDIAKGESSWNFPIPTAVFHTETGKVAPCKLSFPSGGSEPERHFDRPLKYGVPETGEYTIVTQPYARSWPYRVEDWEDPESGKLLVKIYGSEGSYETADPNSSEDAISALERSIQLSKTIPAWGRYGSYPFMLPRYFAWEKIWI